VVDQNLREGEKNGWISSSGGKKEKGEAEKKFEIGRLRQWRVLARLGWTEQQIAQGGKKLG